MTKLAMQRERWNAVCSHLLPQMVKTEEAAFLLGSHDISTKTINVIGHELLSHDDFIAQELDYLELRDDARSRLIKRAHDLRACLIEMHSHPGCRAAAFSLVDFAGLHETVPHMLWRLRGQPYVAIVVSDQNYDALIWHTDISQPTSLAGISFGDHLLMPTNLSLRSWL